MDCQHKGISMSASLRPRRSVLYMPASNARALEKAKVLDADGIIIDLEDAVAPDVKELAREQACAAIAAGGFGSREVILRVNGLDTVWGQADVVAAAKAGADAILFPKISTAAEVARCEAALTAAGVAAPTRLWIMIETPLAILNLADIAATAAMPASRLSCFVCVLQRYDPATFSAHADLTNHCIQETSDAYGRYAAAQSVRGRRLASARA